MSGETDWERLCISILLLDSTGKARQFSVQLGWLRYVQRGVREFKTQIYGWTAVIIVIIIYWLFFLYLYLQGGKGGVSVSCWIWLDGWIFVVCVYARVCLQVRYRVTAARLFGSTRFNSWFAIRVVGMNAAIESNMICKPNLSSMTKDKNKL